jgi:hypothetical protein
VTATVSLTETGILTAVRALLLSVLAASVEVVRGQQNRVTEPDADDFVLMTPILRDRLSTNVDAYMDVPGAGTRASLQATRVTVQLDVHGPNSAENAQVVSTLFRGGYACDFLAATNYAVQPLYASDPRQAPFVNGEAQYEERWTVDAVLQANIVVSTPQEFAGAVTATPVPADLSAIRLSATATTP